MRQCPGRVLWKYSVGCLQPSLWPLPPAWAPRTVALSAAMSPAAPGCVLVLAHPLTMAGGARGPCYRHQLCQPCSALRDGARGWGNGLHQSHLCSQLTCPSGAAAAAWQPDCRGHHAPEMPYLPLCLQRCPPSLGKAAWWPCLQLFLRLFNCPSSVCNGGRRNLVTRLYSNCIVCSSYLRYIPVFSFGSWRTVSVFASLLMDRRSVPHCFAG